MGEVWQARDTRLRRDVAIKSLPGALAHDPARLTRLEREAELLAALNHPHIATIYGLEQSNGASFLVMELVEGDTLDDRIRRGPMPAKEALTLAEQIARALEAAHDKSIVHRDLKPANIKITRDGRVKVLDFGIAKALAAPDGGETVTMPGATATGMVVGTPAYMSPEQARGEAVRAQSDIWSFGAVLYQMLTGVSPFARKTTAETFASVLQSQPDYGALPADTPVLARRLVARCLERDPARRLQHMGDVRILLEEALASGGSGTAAPVSAARRPIRWIAAGLVATLLAGLALGALVSRRPPVVASSPIYLSAPFEGRPTSFPFGTRQIAIARDGSMFALASTRGLQVRRIDRRDNLVVWKGPSNDPFFSPDGEWIAAFIDTGLIKLPVRGGTPVTIANVTERAAGGTWRPDGTIVFATTEGLFEVSAQGGAPRLIAAPDRSRGETLYAWPHDLPGGQSILYSAISRDNRDSQVMLMDLASRERRVLVRGGSAAYLSSEQLVYLADSTLHVAAFDTATGRLRGKPVAIPDVTLSVAADNGAASFAVADTGTLLFLSPTTAAKSTLEWIDRRGQREPLHVEPAYYGYTSVSPDGSRVALERTTNGNRDVWILDLKRLTQTQLTDGPTEDMIPTWSADGQRVFFASDRTGNFDLYVQAADGASNATLVASAPGFQAPNAATPDGAGLVVLDRFDDLALVNLAKPDHLEPLLNSRSFEERLAQVSPDGRWVAYESNESGDQFEIVLRSFPDVRQRREILSINGGRFPRWGPRGTDELYYLSSDGAMMAVPLKLSPAVAIGTPKKLFDWLKPPPGRSGFMYDVAPDGRFLMRKLQAAGDDPSTSVSVVLNWIGSLSRDAAPPKLQAPAQ